MRTVLYSCILLLICISSLANAQTPESQNKGPIWLQVPLPAASAPATTEEHMKREARAAQFNDKTRWLQAKDSDVPGPKRGVGVAVSPMPMPPLPAAQSTTVILGFVEKYQPFLSQDRTTVYTEFTVRIEEVFKDTSSVAHVKDSIVLTKLGGVLQLPNGKVVRDAPATGTTNIDVQRRYVLFLNYAQPLNAFGVVTAWELKGGRVFAVTPQNRRTAFEGTSSYQNMEENSFLAAVRQSTSIGK